MGSVPPLPGEQRSDEGWRSTLARARANIDRIPIPPTPDTLVGRPCPLPPAAWHLRELDAIGGATAADSPVQQARRHYHERMLAYLADPQQEESRPLVTILIPVYNRADLLVEAVRSCLEQSWRQIEILVVDDGSDQDPSGALRGLGDSVRLHRKPHGGVASARNLGLQRARGDFIHLLDSDDLLLPDAVARKVAAFAAISDAALCYSLSVDHNLPGVAVPRVRAPHGGPHCTTSDLLYASLRRCAFFVPTVMMPRWAMLALPPFEEDLRRGEDTRYWLRLALAGGKVIGLNEPLTIRRMVADGLSTTPHIGAPAIDIKLRNLRDLLSAPPAWHHARYAVLKLAGKLAEAVDAPPGALDRIAACEQVMAALASLGDGRARDGLSPLPLLADLRDALEAAEATLPERWSPMWRRMHDLVSASLTSAAPMTGRDLEQWGRHVPPITEESPTAGLLRSLRKAGLDDAELPMRIDRVLRRTARSPSARSGKRYRRLKRRLRSARLAAWLTWPSAYWPLGG